MEKNKVILIIGTILVLVVSTSIVISSLFFMKKGDVKNDNTGNVNQIKNQVRSSCQAVYEEVLKTNQHDFSECTQQAVRTGNFEEGKIIEKINNLVIIFDSSGSMAAQLDGEAKIAIAKNAVKNYVDGLGNDKNIQLSIIVYGHKGSNSQSHKSVSCSGIEEIYYMGTVNPSVAKQKIDSFSATGWTPIAQSLHKAEDILEKNPVNGENFILLVSDGKETCDGDPISAVKKIRKSGMTVTANVIGFDVGGADEQQLKEIADAGGGDYFSVKNAQDFDLVFQKHENILKKAYYHVGRTVEQIYDISNIMLEYNECMAMLRREETAMMLDIHASKLVGEECTQYADAEYEKRRSDIQKALEDIFVSGKNAFNVIEK